MKVKIREVLDDCIADGLRSGYTQAYKYEDFPCEETVIGHMEEHIWLEIDRRFDFEQDDVDRLRVKKKEIYEDLKDTVERKWVGLEDEYKVGRFYTRDFLDGAYWAETKLRELNT